MTMTKIKSMTHDWKVWTVNTQDLQSRQYRRIDLLCTHMKISHNGRMKGMIKNNSCIAISTKLRTISVSF